MILNERSVLYLLFLFILYLNCVNLCFSLLIEWEFMGFVILFLSGVEEDIIEG